MTKEIEYIQQYLKDNNIDGYIVFTNDDHGSEYVIDYYKARAFLSGFTGSAGTMLITKDDAYLWTDGRYFLQAAEQLKTTGTKLMKMAAEGVPTIEQFIAGLNDKVRVAFDFKLATVAFVKSLLAECPDVELVDNSSIIDEVWTTRPAINFSKGFVLNAQESGESIISKLERTMAEAKKLGCGTALVNSLDDIAWLFNVRGRDIAFTPVIYAYSLISDDRKVIYLNKESVTEEIEESFAEANVEIKDYDLIYQDIKACKDAVLIDESRTNYRLYSLIENKKSVDIFPTTAFKAIKNETEIKNMIEAHKHDAVAVIKFMKWVKENAGKIEMDELSAQRKLAEFRKESPSLYDLGFGTILGYKSNGAIIHYSATEATNKKITNESLLLVDSGGQYRFGTTDITRTFVLGPLTKEEKEDFTLVLKSHIALATAIFPKGINGYGLDVMSRMPMFKKYKFFNHGTGHGVGYFLSVHEGPQSVNMRVYNKNTGYPFMPGMITSNEPGIYIEGKYGVRHESLVLTVEKVKNEFHTFYGFETITYVPFDLDGIEVTMLTEEERCWLNDYHKMCYETISPMLDDPMKDYLKEITKEI